MMVATTSRWGADVAWIHPHHAGKAGEVAIHFPFFWLICLPV